METTTTATSFPDSPTGLEGQGTFTHTENNIEGRQDSLQADVIVTQVPHPNWETYNACMVGQNVKALCGKVLDGRGGEGKWRDNFSDMTDR